MKKKVNKIEQQLKKGLLEIATLSLLEHEDMYGYEIMSQIEYHSNNVFVLKEGTLYPILYRLEDQGLIESYWKAGDQQRAKPRKYYKITPEGLDIYAQSKESFFNIFTGLNKVIHRNDER
ncbi:helix-turn-helix transcriptional regulator [Acidaminobacter sp. JC074]|uniref:PadR family transcriptional regulator n=1 Tax=Acidaminobacter sp. JC074 TaxID=2530199 RepID=UPI001F112F63|nr:PadR family transcriptional regulator [Acidaminobacter sp. JC074]MCH4886328.1 helix-turn-helix transcriptional regulator [Acidaminobacter sp. JC074]